MALQRTHFCVSCVLKMRRVRVLSQLRSFQSGRTRKTGVTDKDTGNAVL